MYSPASHLFESPRTNGLQHHMLGREDAIVEGIEHASDSDIVPDKKALEV